MTCFAWHTRGTVFRIRLLSRSHTVPDLLHSFSARLSFAVRQRHSGWCGVSVSVSMTERFHWHLVPLQLLRISVLFLCRTVVCSSQTGVDPRLFFAGRYTATASCICSCLYSHTGCLCSDRCCLFLLLACCCCCCCNWFSQLSTSLPGHSAVRCTLSRFVQLYLYHHHHGHFWKP